MDVIYFEKVCMCVGIALCLLGIIGNSISVYVLSKMNSRSLRLLKYLNSVDIAFLAMYCTLLTLNVVQMGSPQVSFHHVYMFLVPLVDIVLTFEAYLTVLIAFVRCLAVAMPFRFSSCMRDSVQNKMLFVIIVLSVLFNVPSVVADILYIRGMPPQNIVVSSKYVEQILCRFFPIIIIVSCNVILVVSRCRMKSLQGHDNQCGSPHRRHPRSAFQLTCLVLAITTMFIVTHGALGATFIYYWMSNSVIEIAAYVLISARLMTVINSATNFIFYCLIGSEFRTTLASLCKKTPCSTGIKTAIPVSSV
ncbi:mas-related G-protein coupled receptor member D-like [Haliotis asinina]|uniref:mas-related G-protein coupled receptor member D-like n=1 Tax=Haliotis asinina TaxID=109174 RepID=UPI0035319130